jgi:hypothetical protein
MHCVSKINTAGSANAETLNKTRKAVRRIDFIRTPSLEKDAYAWPLANAFLARLSIAKKLFFETISALFCEIR